MRIKNRPIRSNLSSNVLTSTNLLNTGLTKRNGSLVKNGVKRTRDLEDVESVYSKIYTRGFLCASRFLRISKRKEYYQHLSLSECIVNCKNNSCVTSHFKFNTKIDKVQMTGDYFVLEFLEARLPLVPHHLTMDIVPYLVYYFNDDSYAVEQLPQFARFVNWNGRSEPYVQEFFVKSKPCGGSIYLVVKGRAVNAENNFKVDGIRKVADLKKSGTSLSLALVTAPRSLVIQLTETADNLSMALSEREIRALQEKWSARARRGEGLNYLVMELSNEEGIGLPSAPAKSLVSKIKAGEKMGVTRYCFQSNAKEESPSTSSASSGYSSMSDSSNTTTKSSFVVNCQKNSCIICGRTFGTVSDLVLHLHFRYPLLNFVHDSLSPTEVTVQFNGVPTLTNKLINFTKTDVVKERKRVLDKLGAPAKVTRKRKNLNKLTDLDLPFNMPVYEPLPGDLYGVETPKDYLGNLNARRISEFADVKDSEKRMMILWNGFANKRVNRTVSERTGSRELRDFVRQNDAEILKDHGIYQFMLHSATKRLHGEVSTDAIKDSLLHLIEKSEALRSPTKSAKTSPTRSQKIR
ncbi:unnamed protein product [Bursaphelenchus okinawaensis]|uniref:C2H2-type domain-containing protein n=1 Tax=Bursaphelenchus okinawaensis TaxID=465554 RepID=A0A811JT17_9BILA|nr:unnamed protein product [Bursaphelenchus okinawaensis]CAG9082391.1 unnamed protein product [Bursaphelenchus okinawaensis]